MKAYIFDLDGTLLDTLGHLTNITNMILAELDMPAHTPDEINSYVGSGARVLMQRAAVPETPDAVIDGMLVRWRELYPEFGHKFTKPYEGVPEMLDSLKERGMKLGVLSNKFDAATRAVIDRHFPGVFDLVRGEGPDCPRKPDPTGLRGVVAQLGFAPDECFYVGDSGSDMTVALAVGCDAVGVTWGYRSADELQAAGAHHLVHAPAQLLEL